MHWRIGFQSRMNARNELLSSDTVKCSVVDTQIGLTTTDNVQFELSLSSNIAIMRQVLFFIQDAELRLKVTFK